ncbi:MAG: DUF3445 domain-containing protein [Ahrensia sp.]|nr:DUF3445 domain-containing protein [Ahrensia sp.]
MTHHAPSSPAPPFTIGLKPLENDDFLIIDDELPRYLDEKEQLYAEKFADVFNAEADTLEAQSWCAKRIVDCLARHHQERFVCGPGEPIALRDGRALPQIEDWKHAPLACAALWVPDDLILMRRDGAGWRLAAASLCFPSSWNLAEKFGLPIGEIHAPVPLPETMTRRIERIFDNLKPDMPVWRANWSLDADGELRHDRLERHRVEPRDKLSGTIFLRSEYQTLHMLPDRRNMLFTVRIATGTLADFLGKPDGRKNAAALARQYEAMSLEQKQYKGIAEGAERLLAWLNERGGDHDD